MRDASAWTRFFLVRHGRVAVEYRDRIYGSLDVPLAPEGEEDSRRVARQLAGEELAAVISSGLARTEHAAACIRSGRGLARRDEPDLVELFRGAWQDVTFEELERREPGAWEAWHADPGGSSPPGGESLDALAARVLPRLDALAGEFRGRSIAITSHSWVIRIAVCAAFDLEARAALRFAVPLGGLVVLDWSVPEPDQGMGPGRRPTLVGFHLDRRVDPGRGWRRGPHGGLQD
ncbi:MAG: histidine phosphatase family protein [Planctomycetota bacterium]|nr:histidine phosphatase family protein [Planctomycetota bacterium]